jgi:hypothetical protein
MLSIPKQLPIILVILLYCLISLLTFNNIEEDAYIYFRFAQNIANGFGYVFNQSGPPIESGSSLIWQLFMLPIYFLDPEMVLSTKLLGIFFGILSLIRLQQLSYSFTQHQSLSFIPSLWLACSFPFFMWAHLGLETAFYLFVVLSLLDCLSDEQKQHYWPLWAFVIVFSRPEGFMMLLAMLPLLFRRDKTWFNYSRLTIFITGVGLVTLFRLIYFHDVVPHPFYIKMHAGHGSNWNILKLFFEYSYIYIPLFLAIPALLLQIKNLLNYRFFILLIALCIAFIWAPMGKDWKPFNRSFVVLLPLIYLLIIYAISPLACRTKTATITSLILALAFSCLLLFVSKAGIGRDNHQIVPLLKAVNEIIDQPYTLKEQAHHILTPRQHLKRDMAVEIFKPKNFLYDNMHVTTGEFIALNYHQGSTIVYDQMGQTPWYAGADKHFIDTLGLLTKPVGYYKFNRKQERSALLRTFSTLTSPVIEFFGGEQRSQWTKDTVLDFIFEQKPEVIMVHQLVANRLGKNIPGLLINDERTKKGYTKKYQVNWTVVFERNDIANNKREIRFPENCLCKAL